MHAGAGQYHGGEPQQAEEGGSAVRTILVILVTKRLIGDIGDLDDDGDR